MISIFKKPILDKIFFFLITFLTILIISFTRLWQLGKLSPGIHIDEVSFGYEAQSLLETGKDTWSQKWPLYFKGFGEYKAPGVIYSYFLLLKTPFFHHINTTITRLPATISGFFTILIFLLTLKVLFKNQLNKWHFLILALAFAFSPWHFDLSRVYYETSAGLVFLALGSFFLLKSLDNNSLKYWLLGVISFAFAGYFYATYRFLVMIILFLSYWLFTDFKLNLKTILLSILLFTLVAIGWLPFLFKHQGLARLHHFESGEKFGDSLIVNEKREFCYLSLHKNLRASKICYPFWNKPIVNFRLGANEFLRSLSPGTLFVKLDPEYGSEGDYGAFLFYLFPFYFLSLYYFASHKIKKSLVFILIITVVGFLPAFITHQTNIHRTLLGLYGMSLLLVYGFLSYLEVLKRIKLKSIIQLINFGYILILLFAIVQFQLDYFLVINQSNNKTSPFRKDISDIYTYLSSINTTEYVYIYDLKNNIAPLYAGFYGDLSAQEIHQTGKFTPPNQGGWSFLYSAGKYVSYSKGLKSLICAYHQNPQNILIITDYLPEYSGLTLYVSKSFNQVYNLGAVYNLKDIINYLNHKKTKWDRYCFKVNL